MATHLCAYSENISYTAPTEIKTVKDDVLTRTADTRFMVPLGLNHVFYVFASGPNLTECILYSPSREVKKTVDRVIPRRRGGNSVSLTAPEICIPPSPIVFVETEELSVKAAQDAATPPSRVNCLISLAPATIPPMPAGEIKMVKATGTTTLTAFEWTSVKVVPEVQLEAGTYALVGFIPISAGCIAARVIIPGQVWRPGVPGLAGSEKDVLTVNFNVLKNVMFYEMGRFPHLQIPEFQFLSASADTSETVILYLIKVA